MKHRAALIAGVAAACGQLLLAQQEELPTFRTGVEVVQFDAVVTDADGNFVTDLTADDFEVLENGVPRPLTGFSLVDIPIGPAFGPAGAWPVEPDVRSNAGPEGRVYIIALDAKMSPEMALRTRALVRWFLEEHFRPNDIGAVVFLGGGLLTDGENFTSDPRLLLAATDKFMGGDTTPFRRSAEWSLRHLAEILAVMPGGRKALLLFGGGAQGLPFSVEEIERRRPSAIALRFGSDDGLDAISAATRGSVLVYPINPAGLTTEFGGIEELEERMDAALLANMTGGFSVFGSNSFRAAFDRIVRDNSTYYALGFQSAYTARDGRFIPVEVRVKRPGLLVQARAGYVAPARRPRDRPEAATAAIGALEHPVTTRGLPIRAFAAPYKGTQAAAAVALVVEVDVAALGFLDRDDAAADLEISYLATDARERAYPGGRHAISLSLPTDASVWLSEVRLLSQIALPEGHFQLRVAAGSGTQAGSVVYDLDVPDFDDGPLVMSGVSITSTDAGAVRTFKATVASDAGRKSVRCRPPSCFVPLLGGAPSDEDPLVDALPQVPTTARAFYKEERIALYAEVYENRQQRRDARAHAITFTTALRGEDGTVYPMTSETRLSTAERRPSGGYGFTAEFALNELPLGRYVLTVEARSDADGSGTVSRALPIVVQ